VEQQVKVKATEKGNRKSQMQSTEHLSRNISWFIQTEILIRKEKDVCK